MGEVLTLKTFLYDRGMIVADFGNDTDIFEASERVVYQKMLSKMRMEGGEVIVLARDTRGSCRPSMEDFSVYPLGGVDSSLYH